MDKANMPLKRPRRFDLSFQRKAANKPQNLRITKPRSRDTKGRGSWFGRAIKKILRWFGWGRKGSGVGGYPQRDQAFLNRIALRRRRRKLGNISRRRNR